MTKKKIESLGFEEAVKELEDIIDQMESENNTLEKSLELYERGQALSKHCEQILQTAELKITTLTYPEDEMQVEK